MELLSMAMLWIFTVICGVIALLLLRFWNQTRYRQKGLPPGTMGWPLLGENSEFFKNGQVFIKQKKARYGELFKSHILGYPTVISTDPKLNRYILLNEGQGLIPGYPQSMQDVLGKWNIASVHGSLHKVMRGVLFALINPLVIKGHLLSAIDHFMDTHLREWDGQVMSLQEKTKEMALLLHMEQVMSMNSGQEAQSLKSDFYKLVEGTFSMPINIPGSSYRRAFQARERICSKLTKIIHERRAKSLSSNNKDACSDMIDILLNVEEDGSFSKTKLTDDQIVDLFIAIINAGYETVSTTTMMAVKYLHDCPRALQELREEHLAIRRSKGPGKHITWDDYKSMKFTHNVIYETLRLSTVVNGVLRKTTKDMELNGFRIPKGWRIYVYMTETYYNGSLYPDPLTFNPWRWEEKENIGDSNSCLYFMSFGGGSRLCPGKELGMVEVSMFLHHFVTRYRWEEIGGEIFLKFPRVEASRGLHIKTSLYS